MRLARNSYIAFFTDRCQELTSRTPCRLKARGLYRQSAGEYNYASPLEAVFRVLSNPLSRTNKLNAGMPWWFYGKMTDDDLRSTFAFLRTLKPVKYRVDNTETPSYCKPCRQSHGLGGK